MKKILVIALFVLFTGSVLKAQDYVNSVGIRGGAPYGITFKHFLNEQNAIEAILSSYSFVYGMQLAALFEMHRPTKEVPNLNYYFGFGAHVGYDDYSRFYRNIDLGFVVGVDFVGGVEYTFDDLPFNVSLDVMPGMNIIPFRPVFGGGLSVRYIF